MGSDDDVLHHAAAGALSKSLGGCRGNTGRGGQSKLAQINVRLQQQVDMYEQAGLGQPAGLQRRTTKAASLVRCRPFNTESAGVAEPCSHTDGDHMFTHHSVLACGAGVLVSDCRSKCAFTACSAQRYTASWHFG